MSKQRCVQITISITVFVVRLLGYFPYYFDKKSGKFQTKWFLLLYPIVFVVFLCTALSWVSTSLFDALRITALTDTANIVIGLYTLANCMLFTFSYVSPYFYISRLIRVGYEAKKAMQITNISSQLFDWQSLNKYWFKFLIIPILSISVNHLRILRLAQSVRGEYLKFLIIDISLYVTEIISNLHFALLLYTSLTFSVINGKLIDIMDEANRLNRDFFVKKDNRNNIMQHFCDLSDRLDRVAEMHYRCSSVLEQLQSIFTGAVTLWTIFKQTTLVKHLSMIYLTFQWMQIEESGRSFEYPLHLMLYALLLSILVGWELFMLTKECARATQEVSSKTNTLQL